MLTIEADEEWQVLMHKYLNMSMSEMIDKRDERLGVIAVPYHLVASLSKVNHQTHVPRRRTAGIS